jgi:hypothetical protein
LDRLKETLSHRERECLDMSNRNKHTEQEVLRLQDKARELTKVAEQRDLELRRTGEAYEAAHLDLLKSRDEQTRLHDEQVCLSRALDLKLAEQGDLVRRSEQEMLRNRNIT